MIFATHHKQYLDQLISQEMVKDLRSCLNCLFQIDRTLFNLPGNMFVFPEQCKVKFETSQETDIS